jgi:hypothetical protein
MGEKRNAYRVSVGKPEETTRKTYTLEDNIKMDVTDIE